MVKRLLERSRHLEYQIDGFDGSGNDAWLYTYTAKCTPGKVHRADALSTENGGAELNLKVA